MNKQVITTYVHRFEYKNAKSKEMFLVDEFPTSGSTGNWIYCQSYKLTKYADEKPSTTPWTKINNKLGMSRLYGKKCIIAPAVGKHGCKFLGYEEEGENYDR